MHQVEKVIRKIKGEEKVVDFLFGSGYLTANPPEIKDKKGYNLMSGFGFSIKFWNGREKNPDYYALEIWGKNAEHMARMGYKGQLIEVSGRIRVDKFKNKDGVDKTVNVLTVERFTCLQRKGESNQPERTIEKPQTNESVDAKTVEKIEEKAVNTIVKQKEEDEFPF